MRTWLLVLALSVACNKHKDAGPGSAVGSGSGSAAGAGSAGSGSAMVAPADAMAAADAVAPVDAPSEVDASAPDAASGPAPINADKLLDVETIGPLRFGMTDAQLLKALGAPKDKHLSDEAEGATGDFISTYTWPGIIAELAGATKDGAAKARLFTIEAPATYASKRGIKIGSTLAEVQAAYPRSPDSNGDDLSQYLVGSPYGGMMFVLENDKVKQILLGVMAF